MHPHNHGAQYLIQPNLDRMRQESSVLDILLQTQLAFWSKDTHMKIMKIRRESTSDLENSVQEFQYHELQTKIIDPTLFQLNPFEILAVCGAPDIDNDPPPI